MNQDSMDIIKANQKRKEWQSVPCSRCKELEARLAEIQDCKTCERKYAEGRRAGIEESAKVADEMADPEAMIDDQPRPWAVAEAIRKLANEGK